MFTGLVEEVGIVRDVTPLDSGRRLDIAAPGIAGELRAGDSVAVDGVCLTVVAPGSDAFGVEVVATTLGRTTLGSFRPGRAVNLERSLALGDRLGGHFVQGHVDGVGEVTRVEHVGEHVLIDVRLPSPVAAVTVLHGSIGLDGVSMTVNALRAEEVAQVAVIPYTWQHTNLSRLRSGDPVNLEGDMLGRFVVAYLQKTRG